MLLLKLNFTGEVLKFLQNFYTFQLFDRENKSKVLKENVKIGGVATFRDFTGKYGPS